MNTNPGVVGRKLGMTQLVAEDGTVTPCTVVEARAFVVGKRTQEKDGYDALIIGFGELKEKHTTKPVAGFFKKNGVDAKKHLKELRCSAEHAAKFELGAEVKLDEIFVEGQFVDVQSTSRGRGFSGVMRRHNFKGAVNSHGAHEYKRHGGSIGSNMTPGRVFKNKKMPGQGGNKTVSVLNQKVAKVLAEDGLVLIRGGIPGARGAMITVRGAVKKKNGGVPQA
ncbi:MAG: 50S ribosomal protein L3 [Polyangiaceae bacterium]